MITIERGIWGNKSFSDTSELLSYLRDLQSFYAPLRPWMSQAEANLRVLDEAVSYLANAPSNAQNATQYVEVALKHARQIHLGDFGIPPTETEDGKFVKSFYDVSPELAAKVAIQLAAPRNASTDHQATLIVSAYRYPKLTGQRGWTFAQASTTKINAFERELSGAEGARKKLVEESEQLLSAWKNTFDARVVEIERQANDQRASIQKSWDDLKDVYDSQLALQAPRTYWEKQRDAHRIGAIEAKAQFRRLGGGSTILAIAILIFIWSTTASKSADVPIALWLLSGAVLGVAFWVIRLFSRLYLSREHLARDAEERVTMIETYLALVQHGRVKEDDLKFVLASIFRPTEDGLVKDDTLPSPLLDLFQQAKSK